MLCEPIIQSICIPGLAFAITLSKHEAFLAYRYKRKQRLESKQLESLGEVCYFNAGVNNVQVLTHMDLSAVFAALTPDTAMGFALLCAMTSLHAQDCVSNAPFGFCYCCC